MKVIDLLNKIANGEEVPKEIKYDTMNYVFRHYDYKEVHGELIDEQSSWLEKIDFYKLNDEVEIIEEPKKIEYPILHKTAPSETTGDQMPNWRNLIDCNFEHLNKTIYQLIDEINEIIDYIMEEK